MDIRRAPQCISWMRFCRTASQCRTVLTGSTTRSRKGAYCMKSHSCAQNEFRRQPPWRLPRSSFACADAFRFHFEIP